MEQVDNLIAKNVMILTKELKDKIDEAWSYQAASSCGWAMSELDKFALTALHKGKIEVEGYNSDINDLKDFFVWKKHDIGMSQIPVLRAIPNDKIVDIINGLINDFSIDQISLKEIDINNHYFHLNFYSQLGEFDLEIGQIINGGNVEENIDKYNNLRLGFKNEKHYSLTYEIKINKFLGLFNGLEEKSIEFNRLEIR